VSGDTFFAGVSVGGYALLAIMLLSFLQWHMPGRVVQKLLHKTQDGLATRLPLRATSHRSETIAHGSIPAPISARSRFGGGPLRRSGTPRPVEFSPPALHVALTVIARTFEEKRSFLSCSTKCTHTREDSSRIFLRIDTPSSDDIMFANAAGDFGLRQAIDLASTLSFQIGDEFRLSRGGANCFDECLGGDPIIVRL
jgi:hypothetical protein